MTGSSSNRISTKPPIPPKTNGHYYRNKAPVATNIFVVSLLVIIPFHTQTPYVTSHPTGGTSIGPHLSSVSFHNPPSIGIDEIRNDEHTATSTSTTTTNTHHNSTTSNPTENWPFSSIVRASSKDLSYIIGAIRTKPRRKKNNEHLPTRTQSTIPRSGLPPLSFQQHNRPQRRKRRVRRRRYRRYSPPPYSPTVEMEEAKRGDTKPALSYHRNYHHNVSHRYPSPRYPNPRYPNPRYPNPRYPNPRYPNPLTDRRGGGEGEELEEERATQKQQQQPTTTITPHHSLDRGGGERTTPIPITEKYDTDQPAPFHSRGGTTTFSTTPTNDPQTPPPPTTLPSRQPYSHAQRQKGNPVVYRYFGRSRSASIKSEPVPFVILGPQVDHWKMVGTILAQRGFNVMVCERVLPERDRHPGYSTSVGVGVNVDADVDGEKDEDEREGLVYGEEGETLGEDEEKEEEQTEGEALILAVLEELKWKKAILIGCDRDAIPAIEAALHLAPDRVAGLVLCGDLTHAEGHVETLVKSVHSSSVSLNGTKTTVEKDNDPSSFSDTYRGDPNDILARNQSQPPSLDSFLRDYIKCPCTIIWDGIVSSPSSSVIGGTEATAVLAPTTSNTEGRRAVVGGGLAPHRVLPEQFAWTVKRFIEENVKPHRYDERRRHRRSSTGLEPLLDKEDWEAWERLPFLLPLEVEQVLRNIFFEGSLVVSGRGVAGAILYASLARAGLYQYKSYRWRRGLGGVYATVVGITRGFLTLVLPVVFARNEGRREGIDDDGGEDDVMDDIYSMRRRSTSAYDLEQRLRRIRQERREEFDRKRRQIRKRVNLSDLDQTIM